jgi:hypothetical protein
LKHIWLKLAKRILKKAKDTQTLLFVHYNGHGFIKKGDVNQNTRIHHCDGASSNIESWGVQLAEELNVTVVMQLDCCRTIV